MTEMLQMLPLSPVREWAMSRSFISSLHQRDAELRRALRNKTRGDRDDLARRFPGAAAARRTVGVERLDLVADLDGLTQRLGAAGHAHAHLVRLAGSRSLAMQCVDADQVAAQLGGLRTCH